MKTTTTAVAAVLLILTACGDAAPAPDAEPTEAPEVAAVLDWIEAADMDFGAAPFSPPGWPYRSGDRLDHETLIQLHKRFPEFLGIKAVTWVDGRAFGAAFNLNHPGPGAIYEGHFPQKVDRDFYESARRFGFEEGDLPPDGNVERALGDHIEANVYNAVIDSLDMLRARWHESFRGRRYGRDGKP